MSTTNSAIQWTDRTWNPVRGCSRVSPGCDHCYAMGQAHRFSGPGMPYEGLTTLRKGKVDWSGVARFVPSALGEPLRWRKPARIFINSMSDLFHHSVTNEEIAAVFGVMAACPQHTFQILTKRADRMREWFAWAEKRGEDGLRLFSEDPLDWRIRQLCHVEARRRGVDMNADERQNHGGPWPLPNCWLGVSAEDQQRADERIPHLLATPAAVRFVSAEPLLGPIDLHIPTRLGHRRSDGETNCDHCCNGDRCDDPMHIYRHRCPYCRGTGAARRLDWVIVGGESGPGARPCDVAWVRSIVSQCRDAGVSCFVKQLGADPFDHSVNEVFVGGPDSGHAKHAKLLGDGRVEFRQWLKDRKGGDPSEWPAELRVREFPAAPAVTAELRAAERGRA